MRLKSIGYSGRPGLHPGSAARTHKTLGTVVAILWVFGIASLISLFGQSTVAADTKDYPELRNRTMSSEELEKILKKDHGAKLHNVTINGRLRLPENMEQLQAFHVTLPDGLDASSRTGNYVGFYDSTFGGLVDFYQATIKAMEFRDCEFQDTTKFHSLQADKISIVSSTFRSRANFGNMKITSKIDLYEADFEGYTNFVGSMFGSYVHIWRLDSSKPIILEWSQISDSWLPTEESWIKAATSRAERESRARQVETELRLLKKNFEDIGEKRDALEVNRALILFHRSHFLSYKNVDWWLTYILQWPTSYGVSPYRPVGIAFVIIGLFAILFFRSMSLIAWMVRILQRLQSTGELAIAYYIVSTHSCLY